MGTIVYLPWMVPKCLYFIVWTTDYILVEWNEEISNQSWQWPSSLVPNKSQPSSVYSRSEIIVLTVYMVYSFSKYKLLLPVICHAKYAKTHIAFVLTPKEFDWPLSKSITVSSLASSLSQESFIMNISLALNSQSS